MLRNGFFALIFLFATIPCLAQVRVNVFATTPDAIGTQLAYQVREGIRRSAGLAYEDVESRSVIRLKLVTINPNGDSQNTQFDTIYSIVLTVVDLADPSASYFYQNYVGVCGANRIAYCAASIVADTDQLAVALTASASK